MDEQGSLSEGSFALSVQFFSAEQKDVPVLIQRLPLIDGILEVCTYCDQIAARLLRAEFEELTQIDLWISPHLIRNEQEYLTIIVTWNKGKLVQFFISSIEIPRDSETETLLLERIGGVDSSSVEEDMVGPISGTADPMALNSAALRNLRQYTERLGWALDGLAPNRPGAALDVAGLLRTLITGKSNALLFSVAKDLGVSVSCYVSKASASADRATKPPVDGAIAIEQVASAIPRHNQKVRVNFEEWLTWPAILRTDTYLSHWQVIRLVADKVSVHADKNGLHELSLFLNRHHPGVDLGALVLMIREYGQLTHETALYLLREIEK